MAASQTSATKRITLDFTQGVATFGNPYEIGPRLIRMQNYINKYIPMKSGQFIDFSNGENWEPMRPQLASEIAFVDCSFISAAERFENVELNASGVGFLFGGLHSSDTKGAVWDQSGAEVFGSANNNIGPWSIVHFSSITPPRTYLTAQNLASMIKTVNRTVFTNWAPVGFTGNADHLLVHQGRMWLAQGKNLFFTDAFDPDVVRQFGQINPIVVPMDITGLSRIGISEVDPGAQSHIFIPGATQIWIYDGSPGSGNEVLRRYTDSLGLAYPGQGGMAQTDRGLVFVGTDRNIHLTPPGGATGPFAIGTPIRDQISGGHPFIFYRRPYLMLFLRTAGVVNWWYCDLRGEQPMWYGPNSLSDADFNLNSSFQFTSRYPYQDYIWMTLSGSSSVDPKLYKIKDLFAADDEGMVQRLKTGAIFEPGHEVVLNRVYMTFAQILTGKDFTLKCTNNIQNEEFVTNFSVPAGIYGADYTQVTVPITSGLGTRGDYIKLTLECDGQEHASDNGMAGLQIWEMEYDVIKRSKP